MVNQCNTKKKLESNMEDSKYISKNEEYILSEEVVLWDVDSYIDENESYGFI